MTRERKIERLPKSLMDILYKGLFKDTTHSIIGVIVFLKKKLFFYVASTYGGGLMLSGKGF